MIKQKVVLFKGNAMRKFYIYGKTCRHYLDGHANQALIFNCWQFFYISKRSSTYYYPMRNKNYPTVDSNKYRTLHIRCKLFMSEDHIFFLVKNNDVNTKWFLKKLLNKLAENTMLTYGVYVSFLCVVQSERST